MPTSAGGALEVNTTGALPAAGAAYRGQFRLVPGGAGELDVMYVCVKLADDTYAWTEVGSMRIKTDDVRLTIPLTAKDTEYDLLSGSDTITAYAPSNFNASWTPDAEAEIFVEVNLQNMQAGDTVVIAVSSTTDDGASYEAVEPLTFENAQTAKKIILLKHRVTSHQKGKLTIKRTTDPARDIEISYYTKGILGV